MQHFPSHFLKDKTAWFRGQVPKWLTLIEETALISAASAIFVIIFVVIQLRHMEKHKNVEISMKLFEWAETDRLLNAFRWMDKNY